MPLSVNLLKLESSILPRAKRATNRNNVATEKRIYKKKVLAPDSPGAEMSGAEMSDAEISGAEMSGSEMSGAEMSGAETYPTQKSPYLYKRTINCHKNRATYT